MVRVFTGSGTGGWSELTRLSSVSWTESLTTVQTATIRTPVDIPPEDWPDRFIIVPMRLDAPRNNRALPPVYGPYDLVTPEYDTPRGTTFKAELGHHYGQLIADGSTNVVDQVVAQVEGFRQFEPFLGWGRTRPENKDVYEAAFGTVEATGLSYVGNGVLSEILKAASIDDVATATAVWGFALYVLVEWTADGEYTERLAVWPRHPLILAEGALSLSYGVQPRVGQVTGWTRGAPTGFVSPNVGLANLLVPKSGSWKQRLTPVVPEVLNSPAHYRSTPNTAAWNTRRIIAGSRSLSGLSGFTTFHTGGSVPPPAFWIDAAAPNRQVAKAVEELTRWDWQNQSAVFTGVRYPDLSADLGDVALAPHQLLQVPVADLPSEWDALRRQFVVRAVRHEWDPSGGYRQNVEASLWQGPFARLRPTTVVQE